MNKKETIEKFIEFYKEREMLLDKIQELFGFGDGCVFYDTIFQLEDFALKIAADNIGDKSEWLDWFVYENDCGEKGHTAGYDGNTKPIKTIDDLLELIEEDNKR